MSLYQAIRYFRVIDNLRELGVSVRSVTGQDIYLDDLFLKMKSILVWFDASFHEQSEYGLAFYF